MNLCIDCQHLIYKYPNLEDNELFESDYVCACPFLGKNPVNGTPLRMPPFRCRTNKELCGPDGRWFVLKPERSPSDDTL